MNRKIVSGDIMANIRWFVKLFPYLLIKKILMRYNPDRAILRFNENHQIGVEVFEVEPGVWIVRSTRAELLRKRAHLENLIDYIDDRLTEFRLAELS